MTLDEAQLAAIERRRVVEPSDVDDLIAALRHARAELAESRARVAILREAVTPACTAPCHHASCAALAETADADAWLDQQMRGARYEGEAAVMELLATAENGPRAKYVGAGPVDAVAQHDDGVRAAALAAVLKALEPFGSLYSGDFAPVRKAVTEALR